jgi:hypothetical protein
MPVDRLRQQAQRSHIVAGSWGWRWVVSGSGHCLALVALSGDLGMSWHQAEARHGMLTPGA